jgi:serpin B
MTVLLPKAGHTTTEIADQLTPQTWTAWLGAQQPAEIYLGLPRFRFSFKMTMNDALRALGMPTAFEAGSADFTGIDSAGGLYISNVLQKTFVQVDEVGAEAAAVTSIEIGRTSLPPMLICNRPFVVVIHELESDAILFMG